MSLLDRIQHSLQSEPFALRVAELQSPDLDALAAAFLPEGTLKLSGASGESDSAVVRGVGVDLPLAGMAVEARFSEQDGQAQLALTATAGPGWTLAAALPPLDSPLTRALRFQGAPQITLQSAAPSGMWLRATLDLAATSGGLASWLGLDTLSLSGPVDLRENGSKLYDLALTVPVAHEVDLGLARARDVAVTLGMRLAYDPSRQRFDAIPWLRLSATLALASTEVPVSVEMTTLDQPWRFEADVGDGVAAALEELEALVQCVGVADLLRAQSAFRVGESVRITSLSFEVDVLGSGGLVAIAVEAESASPWRVLHLAGTGGDLTVQQLKIAVSARAPFSVDTAWIRIGGEVALGAGTLVLSGTLPDLRVQGYLREGSSLSVADLLALFLGPVAPTPAIALDQLSFDASADGYSLDVTLGEVWWLPLAGSRWGIEEASLSLVRRADERQARARGVVELAGLLVDVAVEVPGEESGWVFRGATEPGEIVAMGELLAELGRGVGLPLPGALQDLALEGLALTFDAGTGDARFDCTGRLLVGERPLRAQIAVAYREGTPVSCSVTGSFTLEPVTFALAFDGAPGTRRVTATWSDEQGVGFDALAAGLGLSLRLPPELDLGLTRAEIAYDFASGALVVAAHSRSYGQASLGFVSRRKGDRRWSVFALETHVDIDLANLPLVGDVLPAEDSLALRGLQVIALSDALDADTVADVNAALRAVSAGTLPEGDAAAGATLVVPVEMPGHSVRFALPLSGGPALLAAPSGDSTKWLSVQRAFGPLSVQRLGLGYASGQLQVSMDASLSFPGLTLSLAGLGVSSPLSSFSPSFHLAGLGLDIEQGGVTIRGALLQLPGQGLDSAEPGYAGQIVVEGEAFGLVGLGALSRYEDNPTLFFFAMLDAPLGGPPFFYVTGLAGGFGVNRKIVRPSLDELDQFPLVAAACAEKPKDNPFTGKTDPLSALTVMSAAIPVSPGDSWLALGVRFSSFELLHSFALVTATLGPRFELDLLGTSTLSVPKDAPDPIAFAKLALAASFTPDDGRLAIDGKLAPGSYLMSPRCHLVGGFAFRAWFRDTAEASAGDFVVTMGGYHPAFARPSHYPVVPRVGVSWQVSGELAVQGDFYFALTPSAVMAGGSLEAVWHSGDLRAWFTAHADFLLSWKPFHYAAHLGVSLGASYKIDLWVTSWTVTVHVGVDLDLWGPSFAGRARVDLYVVSFTISFGKSDPSTAPISWQEFKSSFLPVRPSSLALGATSGSDGYCASRVSAGLLQTDPACIVDGETFELETSSAFPCTGASFTTGGKTVALAGSGKVGVGPVSVAPGDFVSTHAVTLVRLNGGREDPGFEVELDAEPILCNVPAAAWSPEAALHPSLASALTPNIPGALVGLRLTARRKPDETPSPISLDRLQATADRYQGRGAWSAPQVPTADTFDQDQAMAVLADTVSDDAVAARRSAILEALDAQGLSISASVDTRSLAARAAEVLLHAPVLSHLGEEPAQGATT